MHRRLKRRDFIKTTGAGGIAPAAAGATAPFAHRAWAADPLSVVDWGPPWIDSTKGIAGGVGEVGDQLDPALRRSRVDPAEDRGLLTQSAV